MKAMDRRGARHAAGAVYTSEESPVVRDKRSRVDALHMDCVLDKEMLKGRTQ